MLAKVDDIPEEILNEPDNDKKKQLLLLFLLSGFDFEQKFERVLSKVLTAYAEQAVKQAESEISGFTMPVERKKEIINSIISGRIAYILPKIEQATRKMIAEGIYISGDKSLLKTAVNELYALSDERAKLINDTEQRVVANIARTATAKESGRVEAVLVIDGDGCAVCPTINGQVWSLDYAMAHPLEHPNCVRQFVFLTSDEVAEYGGIDE